jgi:[ribosomal protein S18]-alanine N-acetyltransferase
MTTAPTKSDSAIEECKIERMSEHDLLEVVEIEEQSGLSRWGWAAYHAELQSVDRSLLLVIRPSQEAAPAHRVVAYIVARETAGELHINNVAVRPEYRKRGLGACLLTRVLENARNLGVSIAYLEVRASNLVARALYEKSGFRAIAQRPNYYTDPPEDAVVMSLSLT